MVAVGLAQRAATSALAAGTKISGRQSWRLLWESSKPRSVAVLAWAALDIFDGPLVVEALGYVVGGSFLSRASFLLGQLFIATLVFLGTARLVGVEELGIAFRLILQKFESRTPSPPENREAPIA